MRWLLAPTFTCIVLNIVGSALAQDDPPGQLPPATPPPAADPSGIAEAPHDPATAPGAAIAPELPPAPGGTGAEATEDGSLAARESRSERLLQEAEALHRSGKPAQALALAREAAQLAPQRIAASELLGRLLLDAHAFEEAASILKRVTEADGSAPMQWVWLGDAQRALGMHADAMLSYERARTLEPDHRVAGNRLVALKRSMRPDGGHVEHLERGPPREGPESYGILLGLVWVGSVTGVLLIPADHVLIPLLVGVPPAIVHCAYGNYAYGLLDLVTIHLAALAGTFIGAFTCGFYGGTAGGCLAAGITGAVTASIGWVIFDATTLAKVAATDDDDPTQGSLHLSVLPSSGGATALLTVSF